MLKASVFERPLHGINSTLTDAFSMTKTMKIIKSSQDFGHVRTLFLSTIFQTDYRELKTT